MTLCLHLRRMRVKLFGVRISLSFWFVVFLTFGIVTSVQGQRLILCSLLSALIHEAGHIILISHFRGKPVSIYIKPCEVSINCCCCDYNLKEDNEIVCA